MGISGVITFERGEYTEWLCISYNLHALFRDQFYVIAIYTSASTYSSTQMCTLLYSQKHTHIHRVNQGSLSWLAVK